MIASAEGWAVLLPDGSYKLAGQPAGLWWISGLCRFEPSEMADLSHFPGQPQPLPLDAPIRHVVGG